MSENKDTIRNEQENTVKAADAMFECIELSNMHLREPVSGILAALPMLVDSVNNQNTEKSIDTIHGIYGSSYKLLRAINNMSMCTKLAAGRTFDKKSVDLSSLVRSIFQSAEMVISSRYSCSMDIEDGIVSNINKNLFAAAVFNLIANSLDYRGQDDVKVSVSLRSNGNRCTLIYRDNSIGIKDELIEQVFNPFFSCDPYNDGEMTGKMGTGLYIVKQAVVQAGGTVLLQSEFGKGINLVISLPQADVCRGNAVKSMAKDFVLNRYSEVFVQLCEHCTLPDLI